MSAQEWLDRTQAITDAAWTGSWTWWLDDADRVTLHASGSVSFDLIRDDEYRGATEEIEFIAHARTALPQAVAALQAVMGVHRMTDDFYEPYKFCVACSSRDRTVAWPCPTITTITETLASDSPTPA